jgi:hypothetical protein
MAMINKLLVMAKAPITPSKLKEASRTSKYKKLAKLILAI